MISQILAFNKKVIEDLVNKFIKWKMIFKLKIEINPKIILEYINNFKLIKNHKNNKIINTNI